MKQIIEVETPNGLALIDVAKITAFYQSDNGNITCIDVDRGTGGNSETFNSIVPYSSIKAVMETLEGVSIISCL